MWKLYVYITLYNGISDFVMNLEIKAHTLIKLINDIYNNKLEE